VVNYVGSLPMGGTDCAVPMLYAMDRGLEVDVFVVYTDSETWASEKCHPIQALDMYKRKSGIDAKMVIVGMVGNEFTIADPNRKDNMDIVGFDTTAPAIMAEFVRGNI
jgi:60 kDa SS-A/Ro ribonucleoprotein